MTRKALGSKTFLYPMPTVIVGAQVEGKANFETIAYCGIVQHVPAMVSIASNKSHYTNRGILENRSFSINIPSEDQLELTDYLGLHSGRETDKAKLFTVTYGALRTAPLIEECPLSLECRLVKTVDVGGTNDIFIGEIVESYCSEECMNGSLPDIRKMKPVIFAMHENHYFSLGRLLGKAWDIGKKFHP